MRRRKAEKYMIMMNRHYRKGHKLLSALYASMLRILCSCDIIPGTRIDESVELIHNGLGCVFHPKTVIKENCKIYQNVTIGGNGKIVDGELKNQGAPVLESGVAVFAGACVLGPITVGANSLIGANSVVTKDVPPNSLVFGNPAVVREKTYDYCFR